MHTINIWNKYHLLGKKIAFVLLMILSIPFFGFGQKNVQENDLKFSRRVFHFGINLGFNQSDFKVIHSSNFIYDDSISGISAKSGPGFNLAVLMSIHLTKHLELRTLPGIAFQDKTLQYSIYDGTTVDKKLGQIFMEMPVHLKLKSEPIKDFKFYVFAGFKYGFDVAANSKARNADDLVKLTKHDLAVDYGAGIEFHFPLFILSPEFKVTNSFKNTHSYDPFLRYSSVIQGLKNRTFFFGLNFEG